MDYKEADFNILIHLYSLINGVFSAYKIHLSNPTYLKLQEIGGFKFELRGTIPVKVRNGNQDTMMTSSHVN